MSLLAPFHSSCKPLHATLPTGQLKGTQPHVMGLLHCPLLVWPIAVNLLALSHRRLLSSHPVSHTGLPGLK